MEKEAVKAQIADATTQVIQTADPVSQMSFWELATHSGPLAFGVLVLLVVFSLVSWAIIFVKWLNIRQAVNESLTFLDTFWQSKRLDDIYQKAETMVTCPIAQVFRQGYQELLKVKRREKNQEAGGMQLGGIENIERALRRAMTAEMTELERLIPFLATVGSTSPFIGLFGTVVGIMKSFQEIGVKGSANLATVAPGIAEALIATAAGLLAAIPAVIAYNTFSQRIRVLGAEMDNFSSDFMNIVRRHFF
ncbi:MAG: protein TolQ [Myxococcales bacterium]|nr:protein TolQ [Myxococcales bacterium]|tara:strand:+ start:1358 stop:2104 length:747 start_codon:yes stop_codon:yes gene_type:complete